MKALPLNAKVHYNYANWNKDSGDNAKAALHYREAIRYVLVYPVGRREIINCGGPRYKGRSSALKRADMGQIFGIVSRDNFIAIAD